jgi:DnaJ-class molecular chaperone
MRDPYSLLGVKKDAAADEIKAAWRSKAKSLHPDHNQDDPGATRRFAEMGQAYEVLKDPERRKRYDRAYETHQTIMQQRQSARQAEERAKAARAKAEEVMEELARANAQRAQSQAKQQQANGTSGASTLGGEENPEDLIDRIFGPAPSARAAGTSGAAGTGQARPQAKSADAGPSRPHNQHQAQSQTQAQSHAQAKPAGDTAQAAGAEGATAKADPAGQKVAPPLPLQAIELLSGLMRRIRGAAPPPEKAPDLSATATVSLDDMLALNTATVTLSDEREVRFPLEAGMTDGQVLRLIGQGLRLPGAQRGDLLVTLKIARDNRFHVEGFDLHTVLPISLEDAVLGTEAEVETPGGRVPVSIPTWTGSDQSVRINGLGLADDAGGRGDLVVEVRVVLWDKPDPKVIDLMRHMRHGLFV